MDPNQTLRQNLDQMQSLAPLRRTLEEKAKTCPREFHELAGGRNSVGAGCGYFAIVHGFRFLLKKGGDAVDDLV
jgi:hypothetical protein